MKKFSLTHKLLAVALAFVLVAVSLPDYLSFAQQPAQEQSETDEFEDNLADGDPSDDDLSGDNPSDTGEQEMEQQVVLHLQAPETVPMGTAGSFGLSAQNTAAVAADVSIQLTQEEMAAYQAAEQDGTLAPAAGGRQPDLHPAAGGTGGGNAQLPLPQRLQQPGGGGDCRGGHLDCPAAAPRRRNWRHPDRNHPSRRRNSAAGAGTDAASG